MARAETMSEIKARLKKKRLAKAAKAAEYKPGKSKKPMTKKQADTKVKKQAASQKKKKTAKADKEAKGRQSRIDDDAAYTRIGALVGGKPGKRRAARVDAANLPKGGKKSKKGVLSSAAEGRSNGKSFQDGLISTDMYSKKRK
jgi:hypothetical protein